MNSGIRPFDYTKNLEAVANIIEICFRDNMDDEGKSFIRRMRSMINRSQYLNLTQMSAANSGYPMTGFVYMENNQVVGNISIMPIQISGVKGALIANVAVLPEYRNRGIAKQLTDAALQEIKDRGISIIWLQARDDNPVALNLYVNAGFEEITRRTTWVYSPESSGIFESSLSVSPQKPVMIRSRDWNQIKLWLNNTYPESLRWQIPIRLNLLNPGVAGYFQRSLSESMVKSWGCREEKSILGAVYWQSFISPGDKVWVASDNTNIDTVIISLMPILLNSIRKKKVTSDFPYGLAVESWKYVGFIPQHTLVWMRIEL
ncbi:MAG: GNAT family N-acetyltransferase [Anaerolineales bacterium]|nr:GNAT family N-acetyltransferase [Anaerolineales bacterium]